MQGEASVEVGADVWVADREAVWKPGKVVGLQTDAGGEPLATVEVKGERGRPQRLDVPACAPSLHLRNEVLKTRKGALEFHDLSHLPLLHEPALLHALEVRASDGVVYTRTGPVLLAVNPFREVEGLYGDEKLREFAAYAAKAPVLDEDGKETLAPHIFGVACNAYRGIWRKGTAQTVLVSGESGAGKTETTKFVMRFLALAGALGAEASMSDVERLVLGSIPLLEALGNAKTLRNDNSSRFGKYIELHFGPGATAPPVAADTDGDDENQEDAAAKGPSRCGPRLVGARTCTYLLEKVRVTGQQVGERSFHVFYQLLAAASKGHSLTAKLAGVRGYSPSDFEYLKQSECFTLGDGVDEVAHFGAFVEALASVGVSEEVVRELLGTLVAVLHIGNIAFTAPEGNSEGSQPLRLGDTDGPLAIACGHLGVEPDKLSAALCTRTMKAPGEARVIRSCLNVAKAREGRDALARHLYAAIFAHVVARVNATVTAGPGGAQQVVGQGSSSQQQQFGLRCIGVLDIFGFEFFKTNSLEQLFINYTNELLQKHFNEVIFEHEQELYTRERIQWDPLAFPDNSAIVELVGKPPHGILPSLDEECSSVGGTSDRWCSKLRRQMASDKHFKVVLQRQDSFVVLHFAGPVEYTSQAFLEKNRDVLGADLVACLKESTSSFLRQRLQEQDRVFGTQEQESAAGARKIARAKLYTVASEFRGQLQDLMQQIRATEPHFVRCVKPNPQSRAGIFDRASVAEQLRYQGVLQAIQVSRAGFPLRLRHREGAARFSCLAPRGRATLQLETLMSRGRYDQAARQLLMDLCSPEGVPGLTESDWAVGTTLIFLKRRGLELLGAALARRRASAATRLQAAWRGFVRRRRFRQVVAATRKLQAGARGYAGRREARTLRRARAALRLQSAWRGRTARRVLLRWRSAAGRIQAWTRSRRARRKLRWQIELLVRLGRWWRRTGFKRRCRRRQSAAMVIQRAWCGHRGRRQAKLLVADTLRRRRAARVLLRRWRARVCDRLLGPLMPTSPRAFIATASPRRGEAARSALVGSGSETTAAAGGGASELAQPLLAGGGGSSLIASTPRGTSALTSGTAASNLTPEAAAAAARLRLEAADMGELLAIAATLKGRVARLALEETALQAQQEELSTSVQDLERWTFRGLAARVFGRVFGDACVNRPTNQR